MSMLLSAGSWPARREAPAFLTAVLSTVLSAGLSAALATGLSAQAAPAGLTLPPLKVVDPSYMDRAANACTDFDRFANGGWLEHDTIPPDYSSSGVARDMSDRNEAVVHGVLDDAARRRRTLPPDSTEWKLGTFYATCMDTTAAQWAGLTPVEPALARIDSIHSRTDLTDVFAWLHMEGVTAGFSYGPEVDPHDASLYLGSFDQGGLGLPDRDYYTDTGASADSLRQAYLAHISRLLQLSGEVPAQADADAHRVLALETQLAQASLTRVQRRVPSATDHPMSLAQLRSLAPSVDWSGYLDAVGLDRPLARVNVGEPAFFRRLGALVAGMPLTAWRAYLRYHVLAQASPWLSSPFVQEDFAFSSRFTGAKQLLPRWKRCLRATDGLMGEALGQAYVARAFSPEARARARQIIEDIRASFGERIRRLDWMSDSTKAQALYKLAQMREKVGYPEHWRDYSKLVVSDGPFIDNVHQAIAFEWQRTVDRPGMPVDTSEWEMTVPTVNAYYDPSKNEMVFPAGALQPQTFDVHADDGANYGSLGGSWAGHELTHGFDDEGRHYDAHGNLRDWWTPADSAHFAVEAQKMVEQFDGYIQVDTLHVNGQLTLGENIADYGGLLTAYDALEHALKRDGRPGTIDGFTPEQRFFLAYAQSWRIHTRPESLRNRRTVDPHSPAHWRIDGPLSDIPAFAAAFGCKPGDPMVRPADEVPHIW